MATWYTNAANPSWAWSRRIPIAVDLTGGATGAQDVNIALPADWDDFWENVRSSGEDIRVTDADGITLLTIDLNGFSKSNRTGTIEIDNWTPPGTGSRIPLIWLYWGESSATTVVSSFAPAGALTAYVELGAPGGPRHLFLSSEPLGATRPDGAIAKRSGETVHVWLCVAALMGPRLKDQADRSLYEGISYVTYDVQTGGASQAAMVTAASPRFVEDEQLRVWVRLEVKAGSDNTDYTALLTVRTTEGQTLVGTWLVRVRDTDEA